MIMQKICFIIITHSEPQQVTRLISILGQVSQCIVVHVNANSDVGLFQDKAPAWCGFVDQRVAVRWGASSMLEAIVASTDYAMRQTDADRFVLLSQSCLPVVSPERIQQFFDAQPDAEFIGLRPMRSYGADRWRLSFDLNENSIHPRLRNGIAGKIVRRLGIARPALNWKQSLGHFKPAKGCLWWALTRGACSHLLQVITENRHLYHYAGSLFGPEEIIPHTILYNSAFSKNIKHHITFEDWSRRGPSPKWLDVSDINKLAEDGYEWTDVYGKGTALFARKFSSEVAEQITHDS
jgi:hypothetical protein